MIEAHDVDVAKEACHNFRSYCVLDSIFLKAESRLMGRGRVDHRRRRSRDPCRGAVTPLDPPSPPHREGGFVGALERRGGRQHPPRRHDVLPQPRRPDHLVRPPGTEVRGLHHHVRRRGVVRRAHAPRAERLRQTPQRVRARVGARRDDALKNELGAVQHAPLLARQERRDGDGDDDAFSVFWFCFLCV